jgi:hypothetical protein
MSAAVFLDGFAALTEKGLASPAGITPWESGQRGPADVRRPQVLAIPYPTFGKLTPADRLAFAATGLLFSHYPVDGDRCAICAGIPFGSLAVDLAYVDSLRGPFPSPALFSATLPSSPVSEIAIHYKIKGPNRVFCQTSGSGLWALGYGIHLLRTGKAASAIILFVNSADAVPGMDAFVRAESTGRHVCYALFLAAAPAAAGMAYRVHFDWQPSLRTGGRADDEGLFSAMSDSLAAGASYSSPLDRFGMKGFLTIEKRS